MVFHVNYKCTVFLLNLVRGIRNAGDRYLEEEQGDRRDTAGRGQEKPQLGAEEALWNRSGPSSRRLLPEQVLAELLRHHRLQPAPLTRPLPLQPLTANSREPQEHLGGAVLFAAGHVPLRNHGADGPAFGLPGPGQGEEGALFHRAPHRSRKTPQSEKAAANLCWQTEPQRSRTALAGIAQAQLSVCRSGGPRGRHSALSVMGGAALPRQADCAGAHSIYSRCSPSGKGRSAAST